MFRKIINYFYKKYCAPVEIKNLYLNGIQRQFDRQLEEKEVQERNSVVYSFIQTGWFEQIMNEELKNYSEALFNMCETEKQRDYMSYAIKILLKFEDRFKACGTEPEGLVKFDKYNL